MAAAEPAIGAADLGWAVDGRWVLLDAQLRVPAGSLCALWGPNGAGKSSLLRLLAGHVSPQRGQVTLRGVPLPDIDPADLCRNLAWLGHEPGLYLDLTALENLALFAQLQGKPAGDEALLDCLAQTGIAPADARRRVRGLSRGMQQRVALARLLCGDQRVWLLDEPATGLDAQGQGLLAEILVRARAQGRAVVAASHEFGFLRDADAFWVVRDGRLLAEAPP